MVAGAGVTVVRAAARAGALSRLRQRARLLRQLRRDSPPHPAAYPTELSRSFNASHACYPCLVHEYGRGWTARRAGGVPLKL